LKLVGRLARRVRDRGSFVVKGGEE
jgi:hypothetical protein